LVFCVELEVNRVGKAFVANNCGVFFDFVFANLEALENKLF